MRWWEEAFAGEQGAAYRSFYRAFEPGGRAAVVVIDTVRAFIGTPGLDLAATVAQWPAACGPEALPALPAIAELLAAARRCSPTDVPIVHIRPTTDGAHLGATAKSERSGETVNARPGAVEFMPEAAPLEGELVLSKTRASAFFQTPLATYLHSQRIENVLLAGGTTSGCLRASVVDAFSHGFNPFVVEQAAFDRSRLSAGVSLFDMDARYADVIQLPDAVSWLGELAVSGGAV